MVLDVVADAKKIADFWDGQVKKLATDVKWEEVTKATLNRMEAYGRKGTAKMRGKHDVKMGVIFVLTPAKKTLIVHGMVPVEKADAHKAELGAIVGSIKPGK